MRKLFMLKPVVMAVALTLVSAVGYGQTLSAGGRGKVLWVTPDLEVSANTAPAQLSELKPGSEIEFLDWNSDVNDALLQSPNLSTYTISLGGPDAVPTTRRDFERLGQTIRGAGAFRIRAAALVDQRVFHDGELASNAALAFVDNSELKPNGEKIFARGANAVNAGSGVWFFQRDVGKEMTHLAGQARLIIIPFGRGLHVYGAVKDGVYKDLNGFLAKSPEYVGGAYALALGTAHARQVYLDQKGDDLTREFADTMVIGDYRIPSYRMNWVRATKTATRVNIVLGNATAKDVAALASVPLSKARLVRVYAENASADTMRALMTASSAWAVGKGAIFRFDGRAEDLDVQAVQRAGFTNIALSEEYYRTATKEDLDRLKSFDGIQLSTDERSGYKKMAYDLVAGAAQDNRSIKLGFDDPVSANAVNDMIKESNINPAFVSAHVHIMVAPVPDEAFSSEKPGQE